MFKRPMSFRHLLVLGLMLSAFSPVNAIGETVTVRIINVTNGHPLRNQGISLSLLYDKEEDRPAKYDQIQNFTTDSSGEAKITILDPPPKYLDFRLHMTSEHWKYAPLISVLTQEVIQNGIIEKAGVEKKNDIIPKTLPGEIIILARPLSFFERLLYPIMKY
jgi:hypothetical protein